MTTEAKQDALMTLCPVCKTHYSHARQGGPCIGCDASLLTDAELAMHRKRVEHYEPIKGQIPTDVVARRELLAHIEALTASSASQLARIEELEGALRDIVDERRTDADGIYHRLACTADMVEHAAAALEVGK